MYACMFSFRASCKARGASSSLNNQNKYEMNLFVSGGCIIVKHNVLKCTPFIIYVVGVPCLNLHVCEFVFSFRDHAKHGVHLVL